jgi:hypothetical protein
MDIWLIVVQLPCVPPVIRKDTLVIPMAFCQNRGGHCNKRQWCSAFQFNEVKTSKPSEYNPKPFGLAFEKQFSRAKETTAKKRESIQTTKTNSTFARRKISCTSCATGPNF